MNAQEAKVARTLAGAALALDGNAIGLRAWSRGVVENHADPVWVIDTLDTLEEAMALLRQTREALRLTREYVGEKVLPAIEGWSWYDATVAVDAWLASYRGETE
jgi:hypothetical protein